MTDSPDGAAQAAKESIGTQKKSLGERRGYKAGSIFEELGLENRGMGEIKERSAYSTIIIAKEQPLFYTPSGQRST